MVIEIESVDPSSGYVTCIYPRESRRKRAAWVLWVRPDGSGVLYTKRKESGAVLNTSQIRLPANITRKVPQRSLPNGLNPGEIHE